MTTTYCIILAMRLVLASDMACHVWYRGSRNDDTSCNMAGNLRFGGPHPNGRFGSRARRQTFAHFSAKISPT